MAKNIRIFVQEDVEIVGGLEGVLHPLAQAIAGVLPTFKQNENSVYELTVKISDNQAVQNLNKTFRGKDKPTNVLSFPFEDDYAHLQNAEEIYLGDIILAKETVVVESEAQGKELKNHLSHLILHGILHLCGYDHVDEKEAEQMEALEVSILHQVGIANPYKY